ncbi:hypothetical protein [Prevotella corporis]|jgi:hypothetical protein|uniref:Dehydrogenase n=1 Tax=Prevotella corporis TaxID=28128 RepID=A0A133PR65_9BACT|nr:hypothetical protein [Prevotella corporis]KXA31218.1 hypothetical protein HMPREF3226_02978 [Prevotella corporis]
MADNYLENHYEEYEAKKAEWLRKKKHLRKAQRIRINKPVDESL